MQSTPRTVKRYKDFASVMYEGDMYMTPRDFLESITQDEPRCKERTLYDTYLSTYLSLSLSLPLSL